MTKFSENLHTIRRRNKLTQKQLGEKLGIGDAMINRYEHGKADPSLSMLEKMSDILNCSLDDLVGKYK